MNNDWLKVGTSFTPSQSKKPKKEKKEKKERKEKDSTKVAERLLST